MTGDRRLRGRDGTSSPSGPWLAGTKDVAQGRHGMVGANSASGPWMSRNRKRLKRSAEREEIWISLKK